MNRRLSLTLALVLLLAGAAAVFALLERDAEQRARAARQASGALVPARAGDAAGEVPRPARARVEIEEAAAAPASLRRSGRLEEPPDALVALHGRAIDRSSGLGVGGLRLSFLSRRPRTVVVTTDPDGLYRTPAELSSGVITAMHVPDAGDPRFSARWEIEPAQFLVRAEGETPERRVDLCVRAPERVLEVAVAGPDGSPAAASAVSLFWGERGRDGRFELGGRDYEISDTLGRARFALFGEPRAGRLFEVQAEREGLETSDALQLAAPLGPRPLRLDLYAGGSLRVRCVSDRGEGLPGVSLWLASADLLRAPRTRAGDTDAGGECLFTALASGCWSVRAVHPLTGESVRREIDLPRGGERTLLVRLSLASLAPGVHGIVVDEEERPLEGVAIRVRNGDEAPVTIASRAGGRFEYWGQPSAGLELEVGPGFLDDPFLPAALSLPFGSGGVVLRRVGHAEPLSFPVEIVERGSGQRLAGARVRLVAREPAGAEQCFSAQDGVTQIQFLAAREIACTAEAPGFRRASAALADLVEAARGGVLRIELERGFERELVVRDRVGRRELAGARIWHEQRLLATTAAGGRAALALEEWPGVLRVECSGYELLDWEPGFADEILLERAGAR